MLQILGLTKLLALLYRWSCFLRTFSLSVDRKFCMVAWVHSSKSERCSGASDELYRLEDREQSCSRQWRISNDAKAPETDISTSPSQRSPRPLKACFNRGVETVRVAHKEEPQPFLLALSLSARVSRRLFAGGSQISAAKLYWADWELERSKQRCDVQ